MSTSNLERERRLKNTLGALTLRVQQIRGDIVLLIDDNESMSEMYLTLKKHGRQPYYDRSQPRWPNIQEIEMLLEAYFVVIDDILQKSISLSKYIEDTEDFIDFKLDTVRNRLIEFELILTAATFVIAIFGLIAGVFGMNFPISLYNHAAPFKWVLTISGLSGLVIFLAIILFFKYKVLMPL